MDTQPDVLLLDPARLRQLAIAVRRRAPLDGVLLLERETDEVMTAVLGLLDHRLALRLINCLPETKKQKILPLLPDELGVQLGHNLAYPERTVGRLMEPVSGVFAPETTVAEAVTALRPFAEAELLVYAYIIDDASHLLGVVAMRELLFATAENSLAEIMVAEPFYFTAETSIEDAMRAVVRRHYPLYPVCSEAGALLGVVHGHELFEQQSYELTAQAGRMVGVDKEEHLNTPLLKCLTFRHPWLQLNLVTGLLAGAVVGFFEGTIEQIVALAVFLPVLAGQCGNTGCQALALTLRAITLDELKPGMETRLMRKEAVLGIGNGFLVGLSAALAMYVYAVLSDSPSPAVLALIVMVAMVGACVAAGVAGVFIPLVLRRLGADPATASTIILTTATDVVSMGAMLGLATVLLLP